MNTSPPASNVLKSRLSNATETNNANTSGCNSVSDQSGGDMTTNRLLNQMKNVKSQGDLAWFIVALLEDHKYNPDQWNNYDLYPFLDAMLSYIANMDEDHDKTFSDSNPWKMFAEILYEAKIYV